VHPVEAAWRKFRNSEHRDLFERSFRLRQSFLDSIGLKRCPPEVALPLGVPWNLAALTEARKGGKPIGRLGASNAMLLNTIHVWAAYREAKNIYEIEPTFGGMPGALAMARTNTGASPAAAVTLSGASDSTTRGRPILCRGGLRPADRRRTLWRTRVADFRIHESGPMVGPDLRPSSQP